MEESAAPSRKVRLLSLRIESAYETPELARMRFVSLVAGFVGADREIARADDDWARDRFALE
jgi:hypothetical protein